MNIQCSKFPTAIKKSVVLAIVLMCINYEAWAQVGIITTIVGTGVLGFSGDGGPATDAKLLNPGHISLDKNGDLLFCDVGNKRVRKVNFTTGIISTVAGAGNSGSTTEGVPATDANIDYPYGIAADDLNNIYISEATKHRVRKISAATGIISTIAGTGVSGNSGNGGAATDAKLNTPCGLFVDQHGNLIICEYGNFQIRKLDISTGTIKAVAGTGITGYTGDGGPATNAKLGNIYDVYVDNADNITFCEPYNSVVRFINSATGVITTIAGNGLPGYSGDNGIATSAKLSLPGGLIRDNFGNYYFADFENGAIRKVNGSTNIILTIAGTGTKGFSGDGGPATSAQLSSIDVCLDVHGDLIVSDFDNHRIRKISNAAAVNGIDKELEGKLYPNPTKGVFTIQTPVGISFVEIYNLAGVRVYERTCTTSETEIDICHLSAGVYSVYVQCGDKRYVSKVIVQH